MRLFPHSLLAALLAAFPVPGSALEFVEPPVLAGRVASGELPPVGSRLPKDVSVADLSKPGLETGRHGGSLRLLMGRAKDTRMMVVYGYARLVGYDRDFNLVPDILSGIDIEEGRIFTMRLRKGHKWSDGHPFTTEDLRFYWEDVANNEKLSPAGPPRAMLVNGERPKFEVIDETTVRYTWLSPNPFFLPRLAGASPLFIYRPAHYLKQFHESYADAAELELKVKKESQRDWVALLFRKGRQYRNVNPELPSLQPWVLATKPPADRFIFTRNPYYHRVDSNGRQLPYTDRVVMTIASAKLIAAKTGSGEVDLQARNLQFNNFTFLKRGEARNNFSVRLWQTAKGSHIALYPNLNVSDPVWRTLVRKVDFRRALSLAIDRHEINKVIYFGLAVEGNNTVQPGSQLYRKEYRTRWAGFDLDRANRLLDKLGLTARNHRGIRLLPDGRPMNIIVETAGEDAEQTDVLQLIHDNWLKAGIKLYSKPLQREVFRNRIFTGSTLMAVWFGLENGVPTPDSSPRELAPTSQQQLQWPKWGQFLETGGRAGEAIDLGPAKELARLNTEWIGAADRASKERIWRDMLGIYTDQVFTIGLVSGVSQPVVVSNRLRNVPEKGIYNWDPGAHFGIYRPDTFWFADEGGKKQ